MTTTEFSRQLPLHRMVGGTYSGTIEATPQECAALAKRFDLAAISTLSCRYRLTSADKGNVLAEGWLSVALTHTCVVTAELFEDVLAENFTLRFVPAARFVEDEALDIEAIDEIPYEGHVIDLGETAAEQLALMLPPFPKRPGAALENGVDEVPRAPEDEDSPKQPNPFAALARLVDKSE